MSTRRESPEQRHEADGMSMKLVIYRDGVPFIESWMPLVYSQTPTVDDAPPTKRMIDFAELSPTAKQRIIQQLLQKLVAGNDS
jgi:hypothetical protein